MKKILKTIYNAISFTGLWMVPIIYVFLIREFPAMNSRNRFFICLAVMAWITFNNFWTITCEGKRFDEISIGSGMIPDTGLKKESPQKRIAMYPKVPPRYLSRKPEGVILGIYKNRYVRITAEEIYHYCILGGSGAGKSSTVLMDTLLANFFKENPDCLVFAIDIKGELHKTSTKTFSENILTVDPSDRTSVGWDAYYRLRENPSDDLLIEAIEEVAQALIVSTNPKDRFFVENARVMFTGLLIYYYKQGESFIDSVNRILEADIAKLIADIIKDSEPFDLWYQYLAKFSGKDAESVEDCMVEMTTSLSVFAKSDIKFCFRDNAVKASPYSFRENRSVFLAVPEHLLESYQAVLRLCTCQVLQEMQRRAEREENPILLIIDEFARLGRIEGIFNALATLRSKKVMVLLAFQSLAQCEAIYSKEEARVLIDNCRVKCILEVSDPQTAKMVQDWCGKYQNKKETLNSGRSRHKSYSYEDKPIVEPEDLITLARKQELILVISGTGYLRIRKAFYFKDRILSEMAEKVRTYNQSLLK